MSDTRDIICFEVSGKKGEKGNILYFICNRKNVFKLCITFKKGNWLFIIFILIKLPRLKYAYLIKFVQLNLKNAFLNQNVEFYFAFC